MYISTGKVLNISIFYYPSIKYTYSKIKKKSHFSWQRSKKKNYYKLQPAKVLLYCNVVLSTIL